MDAAVTKYYEDHQKKACVVAIIFGSMALLLLCVGIATPSWHIDYDTTRTKSQWYTNFFYTYYINGTTWSNSNLLSSVNVYNQPITASTGVSTDYYIRLRNAAALGIVGLVIVLFGLITTIFLLVPKLRLKKFAGRLNVLPAIILAMAALFQRAALSEGQRQMTFNGYSASLYQTGHALTILAVPISAFVAGRIYF